MSGRLVPLRVARARQPSVVDAHSLAADGFTPTGLQLARHRHNLPSSRRPLAARANRPPPHELAPAMQRPTTPRADDAMRKHLARLAASRIAADNNVVVTASGKRSPRAAGFVTSVGAYRSYPERLADKERAAKAGSIHPQTFRPGGLWKSKDKPFKPITGTGPYETPMERAAREERERKAASIHRQPWRPGRWAKAAADTVLSNNIGPKPPGGYGIHAGVVTLTPATATARKTTPKANVYM